MHQKHYSLIWYILITFISEVDNHIDITEQISWIGTIKTLLSSHPSPKNGI